MGVRKRNGKWHYQFQYQDQTYSGSTGLEGIERNRKAAKEHEAEVLRELKAGRVQRREHRISFADAGAEFISWVRDVEYREKVSTAARYIGSIGSAVEFWAERRVDSIRPGDIEQYK